MAYARSGSVEDASREAERSLNGSTDPERLYETARLYSVMASQSADQKARYADRAIELLKQALTAGFSDKERTQSDAELAFLRERDDFKELVKQIRTQ